MNNSEVLKENTRLTFITFRENCTEQPKNRYFGHNSSTDNALYWNIKEKKTVFSAFKYMIEQSPIYWHLSIMSYFKSRDITGSVKTELKCLFVCFSTISDQLLPIFLYLLLLLLLIFKGML